MCQEFDFGRQGLASSTGRGSFDDQQTMIGNRK